MEKVTTKAEVLKMFISPLQLAADAIEELENKVLQLEQDHGMEPTLSVRITGNVPKYTKTITNLVDVNRRLRKQIEELRKENLDWQNQLGDAIAKQKTLEERLHAKQLSEGYTPV